MTASTGRGRGVLSALGSRNFAILWSGNLLSNIGAWMQQVAEPWLVLRLSNSPTLLGLDSFAADAPVWLLILAGGVLADQYDRRRTAMLFQGIQFLCPALLVILLVTGRVRVGIVIALSLVVGITDALSMPAVQALVPSVVDEAEVPSAIALNSAQFNLSRVLGPLIAGVIMSTVGVTACFAVNAASYVPFLLAIMLVRMGSVSYAPSKSSPRTAVLEALGAMAKKRELMHALLTVLVTSLFCSPIITFAPLMVRDTFHLGASAFGGALSIFGFGGLFGAALVLFVKRPGRRQRLVNFAALGLALLVVGTALARSYSTALTLLFGVGLTMVASNTGANTILQNGLEAHFRGRVTSLYMLALRGGAPLGNLATGLVASHWGVRKALCASGLLGVTCHLVLLAVIRAHTRRNNRGPAQSHAIVVRAG